ncbi:MAG: hypothetical protein IJQ36_06305 [Oscillospiraceae bacterium]|nr:hypothetical protein [Oscillospiraceae bacterium]
MENGKNTSNGKDTIRMDDESLNQVSGGTSLYEEAEGVNRDSWLANLVTKIVKNDTEEKKPANPTPGNPTPLTSVFVGEYSRKT